MDAAINHLKKDPIMAGLIAQVGIIKLENEERADLFTQLVSAIVGQQLSGKVAEVIWGRVLKLFETVAESRGYLGEEVGEISLAKVENRSQGSLLPAAVLARSDEQLRGCGLSYAKIRYVKNLAEAVCQHKIDLVKLEKKSDLEVIEELTQVKGIGRWTAEMFLIFTLQRPDVFSLGDLGLRTAVSKLYRVERTDGERIKEIAVKWKPFRSLASRYLWMSLDNR